jgi:hypothetical protein
MTMSILENINNSIPENVKISLKKKIATFPASFIEFSNNLKNLANDNYDIRSVLFKNNEDALYFAGDILAKTFYSFWTKGGDLEAHFMDNAQQTSYHAGFECLWV